MAGRRVTRCVSLESSSHLAAHMLRVKPKEDKERLEQKTMGDWLACERIERMVQGLGWATARVQLLREKEFDGRTVKWRGRFTVHLDSLMEKEEISSPDGSSGSSCMAR